MEQKTKVKAEEGTQEIVITREFDLPLYLLFKAYEDPDLFEQWMETKVLKMENKKHGSYAFETSRSGKVVFRANGTIHEFVPNQKITRTFEMENTPFPVQLEYLEFEQLTGETSKLTMHIVFKSIKFRDQLMQMPFAQGINMAHNRLQKIILTTNNITMKQKVDFKTVSTAGLETSPVAEKLAGLRANEARYFMNKYKLDFIVVPANENRETLNWVHKILKEERNIEILSQPLEVANVLVENIKWDFVFYESGLAINVLYTINDKKKRAVGFKLTEGMEVPKELESKFKFARQKSKLAGTIRGSFFVIKGEYL